MALTVPFLDCAGQVAGAFTALDDHDLPSAIGK
jgi:hypothetical protein